MTDAEREKIRAALINNLTNITRKYPDLTYEELQSIYNEVCQFLMVLSEPSFDAEEKCAKPCQFTHNE